VPTTHAADSCHHLYSRGHLGAYGMYNLTYDQWMALIDGVVNAQAPLFQAMRAAADGIRLDKNLADELKLDGQKELNVGDWTFLLALDPHDDVIGGFAISLLAEASLDDFDEAKELVAEVGGFTWPDIRNFEAEHGLNLDDEILETVEKEYGVLAEADDQTILFDMVVFDSQDTDNNCRLGSNSWQAGPSLDE
jgi:hypothetical protein